MHKFIKYYFALLFTLIPTLALASDNNISPVTLTTISSQAPSVSADYTITFSTAFGLAEGSGVGIRLFPIDDAGTLDGSSTSGFDFSNVTFSSDTINANGMSVGDNTEYYLSITQSLAAGEYTFTISGLTNSATERNYVLGLSTAMNPTTADYTPSTAFAITTDPCVNIVTTEFETVSAATFGTNAVIERSTSANATVTAYYLAYATTQAAIDNDTAESTDMTTATTTTISSLSPQTTYYFQARAFDSNNCVIEQSTVTATTEKTIAKQRYAEPKVKKITRSSARASWSSDDYVETYDLQLLSRTGKVLKNYKGLTFLHESLTKKFLQPNHIYKVRVRATYTTDETTRWSNSHKFTTKA